MEHGRCQRTRRTNLSTLSASDPTHRSADLGLARRALDAERATSLAADHAIPAVHANVAAAVAAHGTGVALVAEILAHNALQTGQLVMAHSAVAASTEAYYLRINEAKTTACDFRDWLLEESRKTRPETHEEP